MRRLFMATWALALAIAMVPFSAPQPVDAAQTCNGSGNGNVNGYPKVDTLKADVDGNGVNDKVQLFFDQMGSGGLITRVVLDNGYKAVYDHGDSFFVANINTSSDVDRDGDQEIFIFAAVGSFGGEIYPLVFADCQLIAPQHNGGPFYIHIGAEGGGVMTYAGDCFAPSVAGKGFTTYYSETGPPTYDVWESTRTEYKLSVDDDSGTATVTKKREETITTSNQSIVEWRSYVFNCGAPPKCDGKTATIQGTPAKDVINGTGKKDKIAGLGGNDKINAKGGADLVCAGGGNDNVEGQGGNDTIFGQGGADVVSGGTGDDKMFGGAGGDTLNGNKGDDLANGGKGNDSCKAETKKSC